MKKEISPASSCVNPSLEHTYNKWGITRYEGDEDSQPNNTYMFVKILCSQIDREASLANQARLDETLTAEHIEKLRKHMRDGDIMPAIQVTRVGEFRYVIVDGNHRFAISTDYEYVNAYIIKTDDKNMLRRMTKTINDKHGMPLSLENRISHAVTEVEMHAMSEENACKVYNVSKCKLRDELANRKFASYFSKEIPKSQNLDDTVKRALADAVRCVTISVATDLTKAVMDVKGVCANNIRDWCVEYKGCKRAGEQVAMKSDMRRWLERHAAKSTNGGITSANSRKKKVFKKMEFIRQLEKIIVMSRLPRNDTVLDQDEAVKVLGLVDTLLNMVPKSASEQWISSNFSKR